MLRELIERAEKENLALAPFVGIGRPGLIRDDGSIDPGGQNLPGTAAVVHNDAVVPGISAVPYMRKKDLQLRDTHHWHQPGQRTFLSPGETSSKPRRRIRVGKSRDECYRAPHQPASGKYCGLQSRLPTHGLFGASGLEVEYAGTRVRKVRGHQLAQSQRPRRVDSELAIHRRPG
jgi:hypothetical protein